MEPESKEQDAQTLPDLLKIEEVPERLEAYPVKSGISLASTGSRVTLSPEVERLAEAILEDSRRQQPPVSVKRRQTETQASQDAPKERPRTKKKPTGKWMAAALLTVLFVCLLAVTAKAAQWLSIMHSVNYVSKSDVFTDTEVLVDQSQLDIHVSHSDETKNILLVGYDIDQNGISRSDSMIILSLDHQHQKIKMTSLMRDMYLQIPGKGRHKLNAAYAYGGGDLLLSTIYANFGLRIDEYVCVDYAAFAGMVDFVGGVEVTLAEEELGQFNKYVKGEENRINEAGLYNFNGQQALSYCRIRKVGTDTARTARQRRVLAQLINKCRKLPLHSLEQMLGTIAPLLTTNLTQTEMLQFLAEGSDCTDYDISSLRIPMDGTWDDMYVNKIWYMGIDLERNAQYLYDFIYGDDETSEALAKQLETDDAR